MALEFYIDIENPATGTKYGSGPITSAAYWRYTGRMDRAGSFSFAMPAGDTKARFVQKKRKARAWARLNSVWTEVGAGIIDNIEEQPQADGKVTLLVSGDDELRELNYRSVGFLELAAAGSGVAHSTAVDAVEALARAGWTFTPDGAPPNDFVYARFAGESVLQAAIALAAKSQTHFYRSASKTLTFASTFSSSGVRAVKAWGGLGAAQAGIVSLLRRVDTYDLITRIYPFGAGNGRARLTLAATDRAAPVGFTLNAANNYIENTTAAATYGQIEQYVEFKDIAPISNTDADLEAAANMLFDVALEELKRRSTELEAATYTLKLAQCSQLLRPLQTIRLVYRDSEAGLAIDETLNILEASLEVSTNGLRTTDLIVSTVDRWPESDTTALVSQMAQGRAYEAHPQLNANSYVTSYNKPVNETETAEFRFRFGSEVVQLQQCLFEFQLLPLESTVQTVGGASSGSGDIPTTTPSVTDTGSGGNNETGSGGTAATNAGGNNTDAGGAAATNAGGTGATNSGGNNADSGGPTTTGATGGDTGLSGDGDTVLTGSGTTGTTGSGNTGAASGDTGTASGNTSASSGDTGASSGNTGASSGDTGTASGNTGTPSSNSTGAPTGGDTGGGGQHAHSLVITADTFGAEWYSLYWDNNNLRIAANGLGVGNVQSVLGSGNHTHDIGNHTHSLNSHTHDLGSHTHTLNSHTHSLGSHTHTLNSHTHGLGSHTHSLGSHTHAMGSHTHTIGQHTHSVSSHTHSVAAHTHSISTHTHVIATHTHVIATHTHAISTHTHAIAAHTHSMSSHTHTLNNHTHDLSDSIVAIYGIFREDPANTFALSDLEYRVNSGTWFSLDTATDESNGWRQLDITSLVQNATTFRPNQSNNLLEVRRKTAGATGKTAQLDAQLSVRNIIQAIAYV